MQKTFLMSLLALSFSVLHASAANAFVTESLVDGLGVTDNGGYSESTPYLATAASGLSPQVASTSLSEGFASVSSLSANGWSIQNNSSPIPLAPSFWTQGVTSTSNFPAQSGPANSFAQVDFSSTAGDGTQANGTVSNWLITPEIDFSAGGTFSFFARTFGGNLRAEFLEVRQSNAGSSTNIGTSGTSLGDFETLVGTVGDLQTAAADGAFPSADWGLFSFNIAPSAGSGRLAFRYFATDGGVNGSQAQYLTIDSVNYSPVPEPAASSIAGFAVLGLASYFKGKRKRTIV
jgi:hypothetical protein